MVSKPKPRKRPGPPVAEGAERTDRMTMRIHPDLLNLIDARADERNVSRSQYLEQLIIGWLKADPRNPRLDQRGQFNTDAPPPGYLKKDRPLVFAERWQKFATAYEIVLGQTPPADWFEEPDKFIPDSYPWPEGAKPEAMDDAMKKWVGKKRD